MGAIGVDVEQPAIVAAGALIMLALAAITLGWRRRVVLLGVAVVALAFVAFDVREAMHQVGEANSALVIVSSALAAMHIAALLAAIDAATSTDRPAAPA